MNKCDGALHDSDGDWEPKEKKSRKSSKVWEYFECLSKEHARCRICFQKLSYKTTISNLKKHVINRHSKRDLNSSPQDKVNMASVISTVLYIITFGNMYSQNTIL